jgi:long-chain fatty acid transport protein
VLLFTLVSVATAGGLYVPDAGVRASGRGGAFVAGADGPAAISWNPAGIAGAEHVELELELAAVEQTVVFDRTGDFGAIHNRAGPQVAPRVGIVAPLGPVTAGFGFWTPWGPLYRYPADGPQRYALIDATLTQADWGPSIGWEGGPIAIGATFAAGALRIDETLAATTALGGGDDARWDVITRVTATDGFAPSGLVGVTVHQPRFGFGASVRLPSRFRAAGKLTTDFSGNGYYTGDGADRVIAEPTAEDDDVVVPITLPTVARIGVMGHVSDGLDVEADLVWEDWSTFREVRVTGLDLTVPTVGGEPLEVQEDVVLPAGFRDSWSVRGGAEWRRTERLTLRGGAFWESGAVPRRARSVAFPDAPKLGYGVGASIFGPDRRFAFDLSWSQSFGLAQAIDRSTVFQVAIDPTTGGVGFESQVGEGTLSVGNHVLAVGVRWRPGRGE